MEKNLDKMKPPYSEHIDSVFALHYMEVHSRCKKLNFSFFFLFFPFSCQAWLQGL